MLALPQASDNPSSGVFWKAERPDLRDGFFIPLLLSSRARTHRNAQAADRINSPNFNLGAGSSDEPVKKQELLAIVNIVK